MRYRTDQEMRDTVSDPMVFRPPRLKRGLQLALGLPLTAVLLLPTLFAVWLTWTPHVIELRIDDGKLHITTAPAPISRHRTIDLTSIAGVEELDLGPGRKIAGTGLPGYCVGTFSYKEIGRVWQASDCSQPVLLLRRADDNPLALTPPDPDRFRAALTNGNGYHENQPPPETGRVWFFIKLVILLTPLVGVLVPLIFFVAPGRLTYRVISGGLEVTTLFGSKRFITAGCTARSHYPQVGLRLWGTGAPGYYTGTYRVDGANTKIYTTSVDEGVLIKGPGVRVLVNPENEEGFLEAIRSMGGATE